MAGGRRSAAHGRESGTQHATEDTLSPIVGELCMQDTVTTPIGEVELKVERPRLYKVLLVNDDFTPRAFVVSVLRAEFRLSEEQAHRVMMTAHQRGVCVVTVLPKDVAEAKATSATDAGRKQGYPLLFTTEPEE
jgi:ATP-dependent Clp protease adaptor protein ClpS